MLRCVTDFNYRSCPKTQPKNGVLGTMTKLLQTTNQRDVASVNTKATYWLDWLLEVSLGGTKPKTGSS